jgi:excisionase family DNA binding protein
MSAVRNEPTTYTDWADVPIVLNVRQVCELAHLSRATVYGVIRSGQLPSAKVGRRRIVTKAAVRELIEPTAALHEVLEGP